MAEFAAGWLGHRLTRANAGAMSTQTASLNSELRPFLFWSYFKAPTSRKRFASQHMKWFWLVFRS
jgi:hypothetical protein